MSKIRIMSDALSNRIAAGEVIERPASVVKELIENSIDAGATRITVVIERAGARLIAVSDDGSGMDADDVLLALEPHGTSKLIDESQIDRILTMGFRGEALPSIASVSRLELFSRTAESAEGTVLRVEGGRMLESAPAGGKVGTSVKVRDLFYNTPARKKFLKSPATEEHHIEEMVLILALGRCDVGFLLRVDGRNVINVPPESRDDRLRELFGRDFLRRMLKLEHREGGMTVTGFVAEPGFTRAGRREQRCYINSRAVESPAVYRGIRDGYGTIGFESGRFPPAVLFIEMPPESLDVNVHPAKREVRFKSEFAVSQLVASAVRMALQRNLDAASETADSLQVVLSPLKSRPVVSYVMDGAAVSYEPKPAVEQSLPLDKSAESAEEPVLPPLPPLGSGEGGGEESSSRKEAWSTPPVSEPQSLADREAEAREFESVAASGDTVAAGADCGSERSHAPDDFWPDKVLGIYDRCYILCAGRDGLVVVDQHAAHERIMFDAIVDEYNR